MDDEEFEYGYDSDEYYGPVLWRDAELKYDEPADLGFYTWDISVHLIAEGSISKITMSPFHKTEVFYLEGSEGREFTHFEDGALCSLPNLKQLTIESDNCPTLTKGILKGCHKLRKFETNCSLEEDALQELTNVVHLRLRNLPASYLKKSFFEPFKHLKRLKLEVKSELDTQEKLESPIRIPECLLHSCKSLKTLDINANWQIFMEENPFSYLLHLEELKLHNIHFGRITKEVFNLTELKTLDINVGGNSIHFDADAFTSVPHLTSLTVQESALEDHDLGLLYPLSDLVYLNLSNNKLTFENLESLPGLPSLETLIVGRNCIPKFDLEFLKQKLPKLKKLCVSFILFDSEFREEMMKIEDESIEIYKPAGERYHPKGFHYRYSSPDWTKMLGEQEKEEKEIEN